MDWKTDLCKATNGIILNLTDKADRLNNDLFGRSLGFTF